MKRLILILSASAVIALSMVHGQNSPAPTPIASAVVAPGNLGLGLKQILELFQQDQAQARSKIASTGSIMSDASGRVLVNIYLDGKNAPDRVAAQLADLGLEIIAVETQWRSGVISAWLPIVKSISVANLAGVQSVMLARRPIRRVGTVTAESSVVEHALEVNTPGTVTTQGVLGRNISIGLVSDSFDTATGVPRASVGVAAGDLPGPANPDGYTQPVIVLKDDPGSSSTDEGRGMAEIVHDIAPAAKICFSASGITQTTMAASIRNLRTSSQALCDVIVDDIGFPDEPFFSDGIISKAIEDVTTSNALAGKKVCYFSAAGNADNRGYAADANIISSAASQSYRGNVKLTSVSSTLYAGGFQNIGSNAAPAIVMPVTTGADPAQIVFQWDDPFNAGTVTTDYNLLVFDQNGNYLSSASGTDNNLSTFQPIEIVDLNPNTSYQLVISLRTNASPVARHLRMISYGGGMITGPYFTDNVISLFGHPSAASANAVAAYVYSNTPNTIANYNSGTLNPPPGPYEPAHESFNAKGGSLPFYFDAQGQRLASPEIRLKPEFAAADGVDTSFFPKDAGSDYDKDGFPNFFGTSAAAPNAAAFAALLLEAAGGPGSLTPAQVRSILQQTAMPHDLDLNFSSATLSGGTAAVQVNAAGDDSNESATSPNFFTVTFNGGAGETLNQLVIDLTNTTLVFDQRTDLGFPFTVGQNNGGVSVTPTLSTDNRVLTLTFGNTFTPGKTISFGIDRDQAAITAGGNSADLLAGADVTANIDSGQTLLGAFANTLGNSFSPWDGYGLVDARAAVQSIVGKKSSSSGVPANLSTRGSVGTGDNVLIGGVIVDGTAAKKVIVRAIGPSVPVPGALADPTLELFDGNGQQIAFDDNWQDDPAQAALIQASTIPPKDSRESALVETLNPGNYTAIVRGAGNSTGIALVEVYDLDSKPAASRLANIATRGSVQSGDNVMFGGFILVNGPATMVVRAIGPSLAAFFPGVLGDPALELRDGQGALIASNDNWQQNSLQAVQVQTMGLAPASPVESAIITTLNAGNYTTIVRGARGTTGVALVEIYDLQ
ncbi:MAG TPA: S8 family serine peptidase [Chthoniobacterales bacterium]|nr:S8 family serine peptidase [Chthoniobacterales bacterium]